MSSLTGEPSRKFPSNREPASLCWSSSLSDPLVLWTTLPPVRVWSTLRAASSVLKGGTSGPALGASTGWVAVSAPGASTGWVAFCWISSPGVEQHHHWWPEQGCDWKALQIQPTYWCYHQGKKNGFWLVMTSASFTTGSTGTATDLDNSIASSVANLSAHLSSRFFKSSDEGLLLVLGFFLLESEEGLGESLH